MQTDAEKEAERRLRDYTEAANKSAGADKAALAIAALTAAQYGDSVSPKMKRWAYLASIALPPLGLLFALRYYFSGKADGKHVALVCVILTVIGGLALWFSLKAFYASVPPETLQQLQNMKSLSPDELNSLIQ